MVQRTRRLLLVRRLMCLLSIVGMYCLPTVCFAGSRWRSDSLSVKTQQVCACQRPQAEMSARLSLGSSDGLRGGASFRQQRERQPLAAAQQRKR